jgi:hypothetical protein
MFKDVLIANSQNVPLPGMSQPSQESKAAVKVPDPTRPTHTVLARTMPAKSHPVGLGEIKIQLHSSGRYSCKKSSDGIAPQPFSTLNLDKMGVIHLIAICKS